MIEAALALKALEASKEAAGAGVSAAGVAELSALGGGEIAGLEGQLAGEADHSLRGAFENARYLEQQLSEGEGHVNKVERDWSADAAEQNAEVIRQALEEPHPVADQTTADLERSDLVSESPEATGEGSVREIDESKLLRADGDARPPNWRYAGDVLPPEQLSDAARELAPEGVSIKENGCPDFSQWSEATAEIDMTGNRAVDYLRANEATGFHGAGYRSPKEGHVWHHNEDAKTMQLVPEDLHSAVKHRGGVYVLNRLAEGKEVHGR